METKHNIQLDAKKLLGFKQSELAVARTAKIGNIKQGNVKAGNNKFGSTKVTA